MTCAATWLANLSPEELEDAQHTIACSWCRQEFDERTVPEELVDDADGCCYCSYACAVADDEREQCIDKIMIGDF